MNLLLARTEDEIRSWPDRDAPFVWLGPQPVPASIAGRAVELRPDPPALEGWLAIRRLGDERVAGLSVKDAMAYQGVSLWWFLHYWLVYGHGFSGWDERYRTLVRVLAGVTAQTGRLTLLSGRADDDVVARAVAAQRGLEYRWSIGLWSRAWRRLVLRWEAETLFRVRMVKLIVRGFLARRMRGRAPAGDRHVDILFNTSSTTWDVGRRTDRVIGPLVDEAERAGLAVTGLHLDHRRNLGLDTLRRLDRRILCWESLVTPRIALHAMSEGRKIARTFHGRLPGTVLGIQATSLLSDRIPVLFHNRLADSILAITTCEVAIARLRPRCVYIVDAYDLWGRALVVAARKAGIRSVEVQHGIIGPSHDGYLHLDDEVDPGLDQSTPFSPIPDAIAVHGDADKEDLMKHGRYPMGMITVTGSPQIEAIRNRPHGREDARARLRLDDQRVNVLFFSAPFHVFPVDELHLRAFMACCRRMPQLRPMLRPHPAEYSASRFVMAARDLAVDDARIVTGVDPFELIVACDIVISHNSTTALDAMALLRPVIHVNFSGTPDLYPFVDEGGALPARSEDELCEALSDLSDPAVRLERVRVHERYASAYYARCTNPARAILDVGFPESVRV